MDKIVTTIEQLRINSKISKAQLCRSASISPNMYTKYLSGAKPSFSNGIAMLSALGYDVILVPNNIAIRL